MIDQGLTAVRERVIDQGLTAVRERVVDEARMWLGTPFHNHGRVRGRWGGTDCLWFILESYRAAGVVPGLADVDVPPYSAQWAMHQRDELYLKNCLRFMGEVERPAAADIALFIFGRTYSHAALVVDWPTRVIHSFVSSGVVLADASRDAALRDKVRGGSVVFLSPFEERGRIVTPRLRGRLSVNREGSAWPVS